MIGGYGHAYGGFFDFLLAAFRHHHSELRQCLEKADFLHVLAILTSCLEVTHSAASLNCFQWISLADAIDLDVTVMRAQVRSKDLQASQYACEWNKCPLLGRQPRTSFWCDGCFDRMYCSEFCQQRCVCVLQGIQIALSSSLLRDWVQEHSSHCISIKGPRRPRRR